MKKTSEEQVPDKGYKRPDEKWLAAWRAEMERAMEADGPDIVDDLPEYVPLPVAEDEVVAELIPKRRTPGKGKRKAH